MREGKKEKTNQLPWQFINWIKLRELWFTVSRIRPSRRFRRRSGAGW